MLDVFEIGEIAVSDPSAVPYLRGLEKDLAGHFITNLVIWSLIGGIFIWGWRRNRNVTIGILLVVGAIPIIWLGFSITQTSGAETIGAEQELANTVPATSLSSESQTIAPTPTLIRDQVPIFLRWEHPRNEYWWTNVEGALLEVTISSDRTLYQASWGQGNAGAQQAASDFFCSVTWVMYMECEDSEDLMIEALLNGEATMRSVRGDYLIATGLLQDNGFVVARLSVEG